MPAAVFVTGNFELGDDERFQSTTASLSHAIVTFSSRGGKGAPGVGMSRIIRQKAFTTYVWAGNTCASACAIAWLSGTKRAMSQGARIGFHAIYKTVGSDIQDSGQGNARRGAFLTQQLGLAIEAIADVTRASGPDHVEVLTPDTARRVGIDVVVSSRSGCR